MHSKPAQRLIFPVLFTAALGCLMKLASGGIIDGACGTETNKNTKVEFSKLLTDSDMFNSAYDLPSISKTVLYEVNCKKGYIRTCSAYGTPKTTDRPNATLCKGTFTSAKDSAAKATASTNGKDRTGVETVKFNRYRDYQHATKGMMSCTLTCHCYAAADLDCT